MYRFIAIFFLLHSSYEDQTGRNHIKCCHLFNLVCNQILLLIISLNLQGTWHRTLNIFSQILENRLNSNGT